MFYNCSSLASLNLSNFIIIDYSRLLKIFYQILKKVNNKKKRIKLSKFFNLINFFDTLIDLSFKSMIIWLFFILENILNIIEWLSTIN